MDSVNRSDEYSELLDINFSTSKMYEKAKGI